MTTINFDKYNLNTGDIILFNDNDNENDNENGWLKYFSSLIKYSKNINYSHVGMILKDPTFISPLLKGLYVWESGWEGTPDPEDNSLKLGIQITPLHEIIYNFTNGNGNSNNKSNIFIRKINCCKSHFSEFKLKQIHEVVHDKPYDIMPKDWIEELFDSDSNSKKTSRFWCSALVGYILTKCGVFKSYTDWSKLKPSDFSLDGENLLFTENCKLDNTEIKLI